MQSIRSDTILHVEKESGFLRITAMGGEDPYHLIKVVVDIPKECNLSGNEKRVVRLWYGKDEAQRDVDLKLFRSLSDTKNKTTD